MTDDPAYDDQAAFSPDGSEIVFVSTRAAGRATLWLLDLATHRTRPLSSGNGGDFRPAWSPDGQWIAFSSDRDSELPAAQSRWERLHVVDLYLIHPDGSGLRRLSQHGGFCGSPKWTPDSRSIVAYCMSAQETWDYRAALGTPVPKGAETQLTRIDIATGSAVPITSGPGVKLAPSVLPSGEVAYLRREESSLGFVYGDGKLGPTGADLLNPPALSPDGTRIAYSRVHGEDAVAPQKQWSRNKAFELYATRTLPAYDRSGSRLAMTNIRDPRFSSLVVIDGDQPGHSILERNEMILAPQWSPDARQIVVGVGAFTAFLDLTAGRHGPIDRVDDGAQLAILNADGSNFHMITSGSNNNAFGSFGPDGKRVVYRTAGPDGEGLRILNLEDQSVGVLTKSYDNFALWSPRGNLIAFIRQIAGDFQVMTIHPDGTHLKQLTHTRGNEAHLAWSPDGERILFTSSRMGFKDEAPYATAPQPYGEIFVMRYDGSQVQQLTDDQWEDGGPAWQPQRPTSETGAVSAR